MAGGDDRGAGGEVGGVGGEVVVDYEAGGGGGDDGRGSAGALVEDEDVGGGMGLHEGAFGGGVDGGACVEEVDDDFGFGQAEPNERSVEDDAGGEAVGVFVGDDEGGLVGFGAV